MSETRIAIIDDDKCKPTNCKQECKKKCPVVALGKLCIEIKKKAVISETLCNGCNICTKQCPFNAISIINIPSQSKEVIYKYGPNSFQLHNIPLPKVSKILGLVGNNSLGKSTSLKLLSSKILPNFGNFAYKYTIDDIVQYFKGTELQKFYQQISQSSFNNVVYKIQYVDGLKLKGTIEKYLSDEMLEEFDLLNIRTRTIDQLSGGELQRFSCACACQQKDKMLYLFDEPSSYLDIKQRINVSNSIKKLSSDTNYIVVIEHDLSLLDYLSDYTCLFYGKENAYGVCTDPMNTRDGINVYLNGYIPTENMRFRDYSINYIGDQEEKDMRHVKDYTIKDYRHSYDNCDFVLEVQETTFTSNQIITLLAENGMGKTTFLRLMLEGHLITQSSNAHDMLNISYKPQKISPKFDGNVRQLLNLKIPNQSQNFIIDIIKPLRITELYDMPLQSLSGGQIQRVALALALGKDADIYLIDEPSAYLDSEQRILVSKLLKKFVMNNKKTIFLVEHDFMMATYLSDKVITFNGVSGIKSKSSKIMSLEEGMNKFLEKINITMRRDPVTNRPRINKLGSVLDKEQILSNKRF